MQQYSLISKGNITLGITADSNKLSIVRSTDRMLLSLKRIHKVDRLGNKKNPLSELFYILLSVQTRDVIYQSTYRTFFTAFYPWRKLANATLSQIRNTIKHAGLHNQRAIAIRSIVKKLLMDFDEVSLAALRSMTKLQAQAYLTSLPRVGLKAALCVLGYSLGYDVFPVDTHCSRILKRMGLVGSQNSEKRMHELADQIFASRKKLEAHILLVKHGRKICTAVHPLCTACPLSMNCEYYDRVIFARGRK